MANWPGDQGNTPRERGWGDPEAPTRDVPRFPRPSAAPTNAAGTPPPPPPAPHPWAAPPGGGHAGDPQHLGTSHLPVAGWAPPTTPDTAGAVTAGSGRRRGQLLMVLAAVVILVGGVIAYLRVTGVDEQRSAGTEPAPTAPNTPTATASPSAAAQTVTDYLEALSRGDAAKALSYSKTPPTDNQFLTDEVLAKQIEHWPISDIRIGEIKGNEKTAAKLYVTVSAKFGDKVHTDTIAVSRSLQGGWWIDHVANEYALHSTDSAYATLTVFGKTLSPGQSFFAFPGYLQIETSNQYLDVTVDEHPLFRNYLLSSVFLVSADFDLNSKGADAISPLVKESFERCAQSNLIAPPDCPADLNGTSAVDGTVTWGRADIEPLSYVLSTQDLSVSVHGNASIPVTFQTTDGRTVSDTQLMVIQETADITTTPPRIVN
jgi:hypothetical protein